MSVFYVHTFHCGHSTWTYPSATAGLVWCAICNRYVGVIVTRKERQT